MTNPAPNPSENSRCGKSCALFFLAIIAVAALSLTTRSFWLDECYSARFAQQPTLTDCWNLLREIKGSDPQMPFYIFWIWCCEKIIGHSELALRAVNFFWFIPALLVLRRAFAGDKIFQNAVLLAAMCSPFAWYYLNEARVYTLQFSAGLALFAVVYHWARQPETPVAAERNWAFIFAIALFVQSAGSLLGMFLALAPLLALVALLPLKRVGELLKQFWMTWAVTFSTLFFVGLYYLWTLKTGDRASGVATTDWRNAIFIGYELSGFSGLGPGRLAMRGGGLEVFKPYAPLLIGYALVVGTLAGMAWAALWKNLGAKKMAGVFLAVLVPVGIIILASASAHFRVLGRHLAAMLPLFVLLLGGGLALAWRRGSLGKILAVIFIVFYLVSSLSLRFAARHEKDDYRAASAFAKNALAAGQTVWWNADSTSAIFYQVPLAKKGADEPGKARRMVRVARETITALPAPDIVVTSRPDVYDDAGTMAEFLAREHYQVATNFTAFQIWTRR